MLKRGQLRMLLAALLVTNFFVTGSTPAVAEEGAQLIPANAKPGECYAKVQIPPTFETKSEEVVKQEASEKIEIIPAQYEWVDEEVVVREATEKIEVVPAVYEWVEEKVLVKPATIKIEEVPAEYEWVEEKVLDTPAHTVWKKGTGPVTRLNHATGDIMCLVEVPATYKTIKKRVLKTPATTKKMEIPAEYKTIKKQVVKTAATTRTVKIPAETKRLKVMKLVAAAQEKRVPIPEERQTITKTTKVSEGKLEWRPILCHTNMTPDLVKEIQAALLRAGHNPGPIDGAVGAATMAAVEAFQQEKGLARGGVTMEVLRALGVQVGPEVVAQ